jgi:capsular exopolysaccharide synthesis family protein
MTAIAPMGMHNYPPRMLAEPEPGFDLRSLFQLLLRKSHILAGAVVLGLGLGVAAVQLLPPRYTSAVSLLIDPKRPGSYGAEAAFTDVYVDSTKIASVQLILLSWGMLDRVVRAEHLADDPTFGDARPSRFHNWLALLSTTKPTPTVDTPAAREARAVDRLSQMIRTTRLGMTYVIRIDVSAPNALLSQRLAKAVANAYLADQMDTKSAAERRDTSWLTNRLQQLRSDLIASEAAVESIRQKFGLTETDNGPGSTLDRQAVTEVNAELAKAEGDVAATQAKYEQSVHIMHSGGGLDGLSDVTSSKVIEDLRKQQADASRRLTDLANRYTRNYPERLAAERDRDALSAQVALETSRIVAGLRNDYQTALARRNALQSQLTRLVGAVSAVGSAQGRVQLREAERVAEANRIAYEASLGRLRDVEEQETREDAEARVISEPQVPEAPSFPRASIFVPAGGALGLLAGVGVVMLAPLLRRRIVDASAAERDFSLPVLAMAPYLRKNDLTAGNLRLTIPEYLALKPYSQFAESLRLLRLGLRNAGVDGAHVVQFTSAIPGEGKSTLAASMAVSAATAGVRTVLVDLDFHNPAITRLFRGGDAEGVTDVLIGNATAGSALQLHESLPLRIIGAGSVSEPNPDLIESRQLLDLIQELSKEFDLVILDTPPVLAISDPILVSSMVDATVVVVGWGNTPSDTVDHAVNRLRAARAPLAGLVLNKVNGAKAGQYGGSNYTYGYARRIAA